MHPDDEDQSTPVGKPEEVSGLVPVHNTLAVTPQLLVGGDITPTQNLSYFLQKSPNLLISTPGRLLELLQSPRVHCPQSSFEVLVLDEADRLLDLGFKEDLQKILGRLPKQRRTGLFSASVSEAVDQIIRVGLRNPIKITVKVKSISGVGDQKTPSSLQMSYIVASASHKIPILSKLLSSLNPTPQKTIVYFSTCAAVDYFQHIIPPLLQSFFNSQTTEAFALYPLHGKHPPKVRQRNFSAFSSSIGPSILLTTDLAARGLDIPQVDLVLQFDPPTDPKAFLHRCGRAGRAGRKGLAIILLNPGREEDYVEFLNIRQTPVMPLTSLLPDPAFLVSTEESKTITQKIRNLVLQDRALHDKAQRAFVSWVRSYSKHQTSSIFRIRDLDWLDLAEGWGLLRMPKMPELKDWNSGGGGRSLLHLDTPVDFSTYAYHDKKREEQRRQQQQQQQQQQHSPHHHHHQEQKQDSETQSSKPQSKPSSWSHKHSIRDERERRREKKKIKRQSERWAAMTEEERKGRQDLEDMIEVVKKRKMEEEEFGEFHGFDD
ncbi:MAG: hypothetical protein Q9190_003042 [Brigantiaea leucoxantha]